MTSLELLSLPTEIILQILKNLSRNDLLRVCSVCTSLRLLARDRSLWLDWVEIRVSEGLPPSPTASQASTLVYISSSLKTLALARDMQIWVYGGGTYHGYGFTQVFGSLAQFDLLQRKWTMLALV